MAVVRFGGQRLPRALAYVPVIEADGTDPIEALLTGVRRIAVLGSDADVAAVLTRLMRAELLDVEVAHVRPGLRAWRDARRAVRDPARRVPLIRDETGTAVVGSALWLPSGGSAALRGEAVVDDAVLFDGEVTGVRIEPTAQLPGLRARVVGKGPWVSGRAAQLGTTGVAVVRDGVPGGRELTRSTFYRHTTGWLRVN
jgi:hypothetical protein